ncbi:MAG: malto-oligosyltrehalose synthase [Thermomicrobiales bacterium]
MNDETTTARRADPDVAAIVEAIIRDRRAMPPPRATYRLQFNHTFTFADATEIVPYLADLGVSHVYASPVFRAAPGSMHGYDVVDYGELNPEIGTRQEFDALVTALHAHDMGLILDFVPNHMGIDQGANAWWQDVLENGQASLYAHFFDIDWHPLKAELDGKVLLPFLGDQYGSVLERGELKLVYDAGAFRVDYWETPLPIDPRTYPAILRLAEEQITAALQADAIELLEFQSIVTSLEHLLPGEEIAGDLEAMRARQNEQVVAKHRLATLMDQSEPVREAVLAAVAKLNGEPQRPETFDALDRLLNRQAWRPAYWRVASEEINYRRFFAINTLAAIRQEEPDVFAETHRLLFSLLAEGAVDGVRIDHPDGLWDPAGYFHDLQRGLLIAIVERERRDADVDEEAWFEQREAFAHAIDEELEGIASGDRRWPLYVVAEKILEQGEPLPEGWAIAGTVGYEFAQATTGLFVDAESRLMFDRIFSRFTGDKMRFPELVYEMKGRQLREAFASEVNVLTTALNRLSEHDRRSRDFTNADLRAALRETLACFSVYRTYVTCNETDLTERDRRYIDAAVALAIRRNPTIDRSVFDFVRMTLLLEATAGRAAAADERCRFTMKYQQLSGPVMAKGLEDTAFYRYNRLVSLNEVGGDPSRFGTSVDDFHRQNRARLRGWPHAMLASSTHDTKRSEDVRARIDVLSEIPTDWRAGLNRWSRLNRKFKTMIDGALAPHRADEYVIYQTLTGTWPLHPMSTVERAAYVTRLQEYVLKVAREASRFTNWVNPDETYESALTGFVAGLLEPRRSRLFLEDFQAFVDRITPAGLRNGLAQQLLKLSSPGVPDIYQGTECWDDSLVDPDNRRPVDFAHRFQLLDAIPDMSGEASDIPTDLTQDAVKLAVTARALGVRASHPELFAAGEYVQLAVEGPMADRVVAFARVLDDKFAIVAVPRLTMGLVDWDWSGTVIVLTADILRRPAYLDRLSGRRIVAVEADDGSRHLPMAELFDALPVALLTASETDKRGNGE